jgi:hypothetical protein
MDSKAWDRFQAEAGDFPLLHSVQTQPPMQWIPGAVFPKVKRPDREADYSSSSSAEIKNGGSIPRLLHWCSWRSAELIKHRDNFTSILLIFVSHRNARQEQRNEYSGCSSPCLLVLLILESCTWPVWIAALLLVQLIKMPVTGLLLASFRT